MVASRDRQARRPAEREERATAPERPDETQELRGARACYGKPDRGALARAVRAVRAGKGTQPGDCVQAGGCRHGRGSEGVETRMKHWVFLAVAIVAEVMATAALTSSEGFTRRWPSPLTVLGYAVRSIAWRRRCG